MCTLNALSILCPSPDFLGTQWLLTCEFHQPLTGKAKYYSNALIVLYAIDIALWYYVTFGAGAVCTSALICHNGGQVDVLIDLNRTGGNRLAHNGSFS